VDDPAFVAGGYDTSLIAERWANGPPLGDHDRALAALAAAAARRARHDAGWAPVHTHGSAWGEVGRREALRE